MYHTFEYNGIDVIVNGKRSLTIMSNDNDECVCCIVLSVDDYNNPERREKQLSKLQGYIARAMQGYNTTYNESIN